MPYMAHIRYKNWRMNLCGGTIISSLLILSAAHCFRGEHDWDELSDYEIVLGTKKANGKNGQIFEIKEIYVPKDFDAKIIKSDISVLRVCNLLSNAIA